jgi:hypothetical protein
MRKTIALALIAIAAALALFWYAVAGSSGPEKGTVAARPPDRAPGDASRSPRPEPPALPVEATNSASPVDLDQLRRRLPDNLYWTLGAPTQDEAVLSKRREHDRQSNELYGKVLSTTATEEEIRRYYEDRRRVSEDYMEFAARVLADYGSQLPEEQRGMYELSIELHRARLAQIPRDRDDALARLRVRRGR